MSSKKMQREEHGAKDLVEKLIITEYLLKAADREVSATESAFQFALDSRSRLQSKRNELVHLIEKEKL